MFNGKKKGAYLNSLIIRSRGEQLAVRAPRHVAQTQLVTRDLENKFYQYTTAIIENMINNKERERVGDNYNNLYENDMGLKIFKAAILSVKKDRNRNDPTIFSIFPSSAFQIRMVLSAEAEAI